MNRLRAIATLSLAGAAPLAAFGAATPAQAVVRVATYSGQLTSGYDISGVFGAAQTSLVGASYQVAYTYDTALGNRTTVAGVSDEVRGGSFYAASAPVIDTAVTIGGITVHLAANYKAYAFTQPSLGDHGNTQVGFVKHGAGASEVAGGMVITSDYATSFATVGSATSSLDDNLAPTLGDGIFQGFEFSIYHYDAALGRQTANALGASSRKSPNAYADVTYSVTSLDGGGGGGAIPEPASWAMMLSGFVLLGRTARRRTKVSVKYA